MEFEESKIKILGIIDDHPFDYRAWSGSSRYFFSALQKKGILFDAISSSPSSITTNYHKLFSFHPNKEIWKHKFHMDTDYFDKMSRVARKKIEKCDYGEFNTILQVGAWLNITGETDKNMVSYHDGNLLTLINSPGNEYLKKYQFVRKCIEYERVLYEKLDLIFTMSDWLADSFVNGFRIDRKKVISVGAGINLPPISPKEKSFDDPNILFIGKMFDRKGGKYLLEAFKYVRKEIPKAQLTIIGPNLSEVPSGVKCLGPISKNTKDGLKLLLDEFSNSSIFVMPSVYEPFGIVFLEAMAHKLPCIGSNICAMPEIIKHGESGFVVPVGDSKTLSKKMIELLKDAKMAKEMGENGYKHLKANYTWEKVAQKMNNAIVSIS